MPMPHTGICDYRIRAYATIEYGNIECIDTDTSNIPTNAGGYIPLGRVEVSHQREWGGSYNINDR